MITYGLQFMNNMLQSLLCSLFDTMNAYVLTALQLLGHIKDVGLNSWAHCWNSICCPFSWHVRISWPPAHHLVMH